MHDDDVVADRTLFPSDLPLEEFSGKLTPLPPRRSLRQYVTVLEEIDGDRRNRPLERVEPFTG